MAMKITFMGTGCWEGIPGQFCDDSISKSVEWNSKDFRFRTSLLVQTKNNKKIIFEISPDIRLQAWKYKTGIPDYFFISHWHWDHMFGIKDLDWFFEKYSPIVYGNSVSHQWYRDDMSYIPVDFREFETNKKISIDNIEITPVLVHHTEDTHGFHIKDKDSGKSFVYLADFYDIPKETKNEINNANAIVIDGSFIEGRIDDDFTHCEYEELKNVISDIKTEEFILGNIGGFHKLNHEKLEKKYQKFTIAYDGMRREY